MKVRVVDVVQRCKREIEDKALEESRIPHADEAGGVLHERQRALDFYSSMQDAWRFPGVRKVITDGTNEELNTENLTP